MNKRNFYVGMGMGLIVGSAAMIAMRPKKHPMKSAVGRTLKAVGDIADSVCDSMGWEERTAGRSQIKIFQ